MSFLLDFTALDFTNNILQLQEKECNRGIADPF
jgi:hypothetical protein